MDKRQSPFHIETCARPNILSLQPYRCARDEYPDNGTNILLDANENAIGSCLLPNGSMQSPPPEDPLSIPSLTLHRYPDPHQLILKQLFCRYRNTHHHTPLTLTPQNLYIGNGSDEAIDIILRIFCRPSKDSIIICPPTYGMYTVSATINDISTIPIPLTPAPDFQLNIPTILDRLSAPNAHTIKELFICSPGNPTGSLIHHSDIATILNHPTWNGIVVLDEAYIDFATSESASLAEWVLLYPNLVVLQTLSKAFGCAGARIGAAFTSEPIARLMNAVKAPYNVPTPSSVLGCLALQSENLATMRRNGAAILAQRERLLEEMPKINGVGRLRGGRESNFLIVEIVDRRGEPCNELAMAVYERLAKEEGVVVRFRGREHGCQACLRVTVGTEGEVTKFLEVLGSVLGEVRGVDGVDGLNGVGEKEEEEVRREERASAVVA